MKPAEEYIFNQPEPYRSILMHLQMVIEHTIPNAELKFKWSIPCYYIAKTPLCYINASRKKKFVDVGFWSAMHLTKHVDKMVSENRKVVKSLRYSSLEEIDDIVLKEVLEETSLLGAKGFYKKKDLN